MRNLGKDAANQSADLEDLRYATRLEEHIMAILKMQPGISFLELVRRSGGAYPTLVAKVLARNGLDVAGEHHCVQPTVWRPELSAPRSEWYFTNRTVKELLRLTGDDVVGAGTPTVAEVAFDRGVDFTLIDDSPWIASRFRMDRVTWLKEDFGRTRLTNVCKSVLLDPPWYFPQLTIWLRKALSITGCRGQVLMPLFGQFTRPTAYSERIALMTLAGQYGSLRVIPEAVEYETPLYEQEALRADRPELACPCPWRTADLLVVTRNNLALPNEAVCKPSPPFGWLEFVVDGQIISVRNASVRSVAESPGAGPLLAPVPGVANWVLDTVSARDSRREKIDIWTSRNRVACIRRPDVVLRLLRDLESTSSHRMIGFPDYCEQGHLQEIRRWIGGLA